MAVNVDIFLRPGEPNPQDIRLLDPTQPSLSGQSITGAFITPYARTVVADGAVGYWRFISGTLLDSVGTANGSLTSGSVATVAGRYEDALSFTGATGAAKIVVPHAAALALGPRGTLECWVNLPPNVADETLFAKGAYGLDWAYGLALYSNGKLVWRRDLGDYVADNPTLIPRNQWVHIAVTADDTTHTCLVYVNGVRYTGSFVVVGDPCPFFAATTEPMGVGFARSTSATPPEYLTGVLDEIAVYPTVLTAAQIANHATAGNLLFPPALGATVVGATIAAGSQLFATTVTPGAVTLVGATLVSTAQVFAPTIAPGAALVTGATITSGSLLFLPAITTGAVTVVGATIPSGAQLFAPTIAPGAVTLLGATRSATSQLFAPSLAPGATTIVGATLVSTATLFPAALTNIAAGSIGAASIPSGAQVHPPSVVGGLATILAPTLASTASVFPPVSIVVGAVTITTPPLGPGAQVFGPRISVTDVEVTLPSIASTAQIFAPLVAPGVVTILGATRLAGVQVFQPSLTVGSVTVVSATRPSTVQLFPATVVRAVVPTIGVPLLASTAVLRAPAVQPPVSFPLFLTGATIGSLAQLYPPSVAGRPPRVTACQHTADDLIGSDRWREA